METLWQDVRYSFRSLIKTPGFALAAVLTLALGIGVNSATFSVVNGVLLRPLPIEQPNRVMMIYGRNLERDLEGTQVSGPDFIDWREQSRTFEDLGLISLKTFNLVAGEEPERVLGAFVTQGFFSVLGTEPALGRAFRPEEDVPGQNESVILSHSVWQRQFGGDRDILGTPVTLEGEVLTVVGVLPEGFEITKSLWGESVDLWIPLGLDPTWNRDWRWLWALGRLAPDVTPAQAQVEMDGINRRLSESFPATNEGWGVELKPLHEVVVGDVRKALMIVFGMVGFVLLIACVNVANLLLVRATARNREIAVRSALGARRGRLVRQLLVEAAVLSALGAAGGLLLAAWFGRVLRGIGFQEIPRLEEVGVDPRVVGFTAALAVGTTILFGLLPALQTQRVDLVTSLKEGARGSTGPESRRLRNGLVVAQIGLALVLLTGAGLMVRTLDGLQEVDTGFRAEGVLTLTTIPRYEFQDPERATAYIREVLDRVRTIPGVESAGEINFLPFSQRDAQSYLTIDGRPDAGDERPRIYLRAASPEYFETVRIPLMEGRAFDARDVEQRRAALVNETAMRMFWPDGDALGSRVKFLDDQPWLTVVGVVGAVRHTHMTEEPVPEIYVPYSMDTFSSTRTFVIRSALDSDRLYPTLRSEMRQVNPRLPFFDVQPMQQFVQDSLARERFLMSALLLLAGVAVVLAAVGVYGLLTYSIARQSQEIGVRKALGAGRREIYRLVLGKVLQLVLLGLAVGLVGAWSVTRLMESVLFEITAVDPLSFGGSALVLAAVAALTAGLAARKAQRIRPLEALQYE